MAPEEAATWQDESARGNRVLQYLESMTPDEDAALRASAAGDAEDEDEALRDVFARLDRGGTLTGSPEDIARVTAAYPAVRRAIDGWLKPLAFRASSRSTSAAITPAISRSVRGVSRSGSSTYDVLVIARIHEAVQVRASRGHAPRDRTATSRASGGAPVMLESERAAAIRAPSATGRAEEPVADQPRGLVTAGAQTQGWPRR